MARSLSIATALGFALVAACAQAQSAKPFALEQNSRPGQRQWLSFTGADSATIVSGKVIEVPLSFHIEDGFHINSHAPKGESLIPTQLLAIDEPGVSTVSVDFPAGSEYAFSFDPATKLDVYSGDITLVAHLRATRGEHVYHAVLRYQACDHAACYPPKSLPVVVKLTAR